MRRLMPRHVKGYLWIFFLVFVFGTMLLSDNGLSPSSLFYAPLASDFYEEYDPTPVDVKVHVAVSDKADLTELSPYLPITSEPRVPSSGDLVFGSGPTSFTPEDVVILFKTGATSLWRRVPIHLATSFSDSTLTPNVVFYSDNTDHIAGRPIIDALANVSSTLKAHPDFALYHKAQEARSSNLYLEAAAIDGDTYLPGGWRLDKYKFLPLVSHAAATYPNAKWYVYSEDDNYLFWSSLYRWLGTFDPSTPLFLGSPAARLGEDFAGGGSGFAISGAAMASTFGSHPNLAAEWQSYATERCCGDQVLSHVMASLGVPRDRRYDHTEWAGLQALPTWQIGFGEWNWCSPLLNIHKAHQADVSDLHVFQQRFHAENGERAVVRYRDVFQGLVLPHLGQNRTEWDNQASEKWFSSGSDSEGQAGLEALSAGQRARKPWFSAAACRNACEEWDGCLSWKYADDNCALASTAARGRRVDEGIMMTSGWMVERIERMGGKECKDLGY